MKTVELTLPQLATFAATRGMAGAGVGLLAGILLPNAKRKAIGWTLFAVGALSTIPFAIDIFRKRDRARE